MKGEQQAHRSMNPKWFPTKVASLSSILVSYLAIMFQTPFQFDSKMKHFSYLGISVRVVELNINGHELTIIKSY